MNMRRARRLLALLMCLCLLGIATPEAVWAEEPAASEGDAAVDSVQAASQPVMAPAEAPAGDGGGQGAAGSEAPADVPPATCAGNPEAGTVAGDERGADAPEQGAPENGEGQQDNAGAAPEGGAASAGAENPGAGAATGNEQDADAPEQGAPEGGEGQQDAGDAATEGGAPAEDAENPEDEAAAGDGADAEEAGEVPEEGSGESEEAGSEAAAELPSAAELPDFVRGYACVLGSATGYLSDAPDAEAEVVLDGGVVYALSRRASTGADRLECAFDDGAQERICWLDAAALRPMEQEEIVRFMEARLADEAVRFLSEDAALPLDRLECVEALAHPLVEETAELEPVVPEIPDLLVGQTELVLGLGEKRALDVGFSDGEAHGLRFSVKNTRIAKVSASGEVSARAVGSTTVRIESEFGSEASVKVTVKKAPSKLSLKAARTTLAVDERLKLSRALSSGSASALSYASSDPAVATVDADGEVVAVAPGTAKITARTFNGKKASVTLKIVSAPTDVTMEGELTLGVGQKAGLTPWLGGDGVGAYSFRCDDAGVLTVDAATGAIVALAVGTATVTVETYNGHSAACAVTVKPAPSCVTLERTSLTLGVGEKVALPAVQLGETGEDCMGSYGIKTSNKKVVTVSADGVLRGVAAGSATVTVTTHNGRKATLKVTVRRAPSSVKLSAKQVTLGVDESVVLKATLPSKTAGAVRFESSDGSVASVDAQGRVCALQAGEAMITAVSYNGKRAKCSVHVKPAPEGISLSQSELLLGAGEKFTLTAALSEGSAGAYSFRCDDESVLTVDAATGAIVALAVGAATVTVETYNGVSAACAVTVKPAPSCVTLEKTSLTLGVGEKVPMPGIQLGVPGEDCKGSYGIKTSNKKVVTVSADGVLRGVAAGSATVTVTTHNGRKATLKVTVRRAPSSVKLSAKQVTLGVDESVVLKATLPSKTAGAVRFESSDGSVASVDAQGRVCALQAGEAMITAVSYNGKRAKCSVHVKPAPEGISLSQSELLLGVGEKFTLTAALSEGSAGVCTFSVADGSVASVDSRSGAVKGLAPGETVVSVRTYNGCEDACTLVVCAAPTGVSFQEKSVTLLAGDRYLLLPPVLSGEGVGCGSLSYKSSNTKYVKVSADGWVTGVRKGSAKLTVSTYNGKKATIWVYVKDAPRSIAFTDASVDMMVDEVYTPQLANVSGAAFSYTLSSSNPAVACVEGKSIRAVSSGSTVITATAFNGKTATLNVKVWALPTSVKLQPGALSLGAGDGAQLRPVLPEGEASTFRYESSDASVAAVDGTGAVQALKAGSATITVYTQNGLSSSCAVQVFKAPTRITLSPNRADLSLDEGGFQLAVAMGGAEEGGRYTFASSDEAVATVSGDGYVTLRGVGTARISVTSYNLCSASCIVNVGQKPSGMRFAQAGYAVALGDSVCIAPEFEGGCESYRLESSDPSVFAVSGMWVQALRTGSATLTATSRSGLQARCELTAAAAPTGIQLEPMSATLLLGGTSALQLTASALPDGVGSIRFTSSNPSIASVDYESGLVTAHSPGDCTITAVTYDGQYGASCALHVGRLLEGVKIGIDPGHQAQGNMAKESSSPKGGSSKPKVSYGTHGCSTRIKEHVTNLKVGLKLRDALEALGAEVYMTRETANVNISNKQRALMMNQAGVDLVLRLHCNSAGSSSVKGASLYIRKTCAYSSSVVNGKALMAAESSAAKAIMTQYCKATGFANRGISKTDAYTGNNWSTVPCILMEMGFSSNASEDRKMNDPAFQDRMVQGMVNGICVYMGRELPAQ